MHICQAGACWGYYQFLLEKEGYLQLKQDTDLCDFMLDMSWKWFQSTQVITACWLESWLSRVSLSNSQNHIALDIILSWQKPVVCKCKQQSQDLQRVLVALHVECDDSATEVKPLDRETIPHHSGFAHERFPWGWGAILWC
jgi:hypothetical protein